MNNETQSNQIMNVMNGRYSQAIFLGLVVLLIGASFYIGKLTTQVEMMKEGIQNNPAYDRAAAEGQQEETLGEVDKPDQSKDHILGNVNAKFALIEYSDYECPYCQTFHPTAKQAIEDYGDKLMWVFRHFPLESIHPQARPTSIAAECVSKLAGNEAFWSFSDTMFEKLDSLSDKVREDGAVSLGVNLQQFKTCIADPEMDKLVQEDLDSGLKAGIRGTPGNVIMNIETGEVTSIPGALPLPQLKAAIDKLMANE